MRFVAGDERKAGFAEKRVASLQNRIGGSDSDPARQERLRQRLYGWRDVQKGAAEQLVRRYENEYPRAQIERFAEVASSLRRAEAATQDMHDVAVGTRTRLENELNSKNWLSRAFFNGKLKTAIENLKGEIANNEQILLDTQRRRHGFDEQYRALRLKHQSTLSQLQHWKRMAEGSEERRAEESAPAVVPDTEGGRAAGGGAEVQWLADRQGEEDEAGNILESSLEKESFSEKLQKTLSAFDSRVRERKPELDALLQAWKLEATRLKPNLPEVPPDMLSGDKSPTLEEFATQLREKTQVEPYKWSDEIILEGIKRIGSSWDRVVKSQSKPRQYV